MNTTQDYHGSLVSFEGSDDTISTQLRLLPTSSQIKILPTFHHYMRRGEGAEFNANSFIKDVHEAVLERNKVATQFLEGSDPANKRLVFLSGGTAGAVSQCITAISEHETQGDVFAAETVFRDIVRNGVSGLVTDGPHAAGVLPDDHYLTTHEEDIEHEDPNTRAMREADELYQETDILQPIDCFIRTRPRSLSLPMIGYTGGCDGLSPCFIFRDLDYEAGATFSNLHGQDDESDLNKWAETDGEILQPHRYHGHFLSISEEASASDKPASGVGEVYRSRSVKTRPTLTLSSATSDKFISPPVTPDNVVYGEARLVQMGPESLYKPLTRTRSLDDMELGQRLSRRISDAQASSLHRIGSVGIPHALCRHSSLLGDDRSPQPLQLPRTIFGKAKPTTIRRFSPTLITSPTTPFTTRQSYVDRGTDAADLDDSMAELDAPFQPVLPLMEDLVIQFTNEDPDDAIESVIRSFKEAAYPVTPSPVPHFETDDDTDSTPSTPRTEDLFGLEDFARRPLQIVVEEPAVDEAEEYDPYAPQENDAGFFHHPLSRPGVFLGQPPNHPQPPTPDATPPPTTIITELDFKFATFSTLGLPTAVAIQNALRPVLEVYFPSQLDGYHQFRYPLLPDMGSLWNPIFEEAESASRTADLIVAMGCQSGVKRDFLVALTGQLEKLGAKSNGVTRSGRLDLRYLVVNAMQSFTRDPLTDSSDNNPFDNPLILATLIIPHLETYLAAHPSVRFLLLEYPPEHLATVVALQSLMGMDLLKIAGIMDTDGPGSDACSPLDIEHGSQNATPVTSKTLKNTPVTPPSFPSQQTNRLPFSKANYLLTCSATDSEIGTFISTIWKTLIDMSPFYIPDYNPSSNGAGTRPGTSRSTKNTIASAAELLPPPPPLPPLVSKYASAYNARAKRPESPPVSPNDGDDSGPTTPRAHNSTLSPPSASRSGSPARSLKSMRSGVARSLGRSTAARSINGNGSVRSHATSSYTVSVVGDGEFYDDEERRLMPMFAGPTEVRKGNSRKALKWLGLA